MSSPLRLTKYCIPDSKRIKHLEMCLEIKAKVLDAEKFNNGEETSNHLITLTITTGRSGSLFLYSSFNETPHLRGSVYHELLHPMAAKPAIYHRCFEQQRLESLEREPIVERLIRDWNAQRLKGPIIDFGWTMSSLIPLFSKVFGNSLRVLILHRHPVEYAASATVAGRYTDFKHDHYSLSPFHEGAFFKEYASRWASMTSFEKNLYQWLETMHYGRELLAKLGRSQCKMVSFGDVTSRPSVLAEIAEFAGFMPNGPIQPSRETNRRQDRNLECRPLGAKWRPYVDHARVISMASELGYDMDLRFVREIAMRYQRPKGVVPFLRSTAKYWQTKQLIGQFARRVGLRAPQNDMEKMKHQVNGSLGKATNA